LPASSAKQGQLQYDIDDLRVAWLNDLVALESTRKDHRETRHVRGRHWSNPVAFGGNE